MRRTVSYFLSLLIMLDTLALLVSSSFLLTFGRKAYYISRFETAAYIDACTGGIKNGISGLSLASGIPESAVKSAITRDIVAQSIRDTVDAYYAYINGQTSSVSTAAVTRAFSLRLAESIRSYAKSSGTVISGDMEKAVDSYIKKCENAYNSNLMQIPFFNKISGYLKNLLRLSRFTAAFSALMLAGLISVSLPAGQGDFFGRLLYPLYGLACAGALIVVPGAIILISGLPYRLNLASAAGKAIAGSLIAGFFWAALVLGLLVFASGTVCAVVSRRKSQSRCTL